MIVGVRGADGAETHAQVSFHRQVRPILQANCQGCHQPAKAKGGYVLTDFEKLLSPGESGTPPVVSGRAAESFLLKQITPEDGKAEMPKGQPPLHELEIELVKRWIAEGAKDDTPPNTGLAYDTSTKGRVLTPPPPS